MTGTAPYDEVGLDDFDLSDADFWTVPRAHREGAFKALRDTPGLVRFAEREIPDLPFPVGPGYWALTRHDDIWHVSRNPHLFCSGKGANIGDQPQEMNEFFGSMINMDDPRHFRLALDRVEGVHPEGDHRRRGHRPNEGQRGDRPLARQFPRQDVRLRRERRGGAAARDHLRHDGHPRRALARVFKWTNTILGAGDPEFTSSFDDLMGQSLEMFMYAQALGEDRKANPQDDITSIMMAAEVDGEQLTPQEFGSFFILLGVAGNETTRNAISHGMKAFTEHPDQRDLLYGDFDTHAKGGDGGDRPLGHAGDPLPAHRHRGHRDRRSADRGRREGGHVVQLGQPRRVGVRGSVPVRHHP